MFQGAAMAEYALSGYYPNIGYDNTEFTSPFFQQGNSPKYLVENSWTPENPNAKYPRLSDTKVQNNKWASTLWIVDGSYIRLKTIQLGYTLPKRITQKFGSSNLRFYISLDNPFSISGYRKGWDPEINTDGSYYPILSTYTFGLTLKF